MSDLVIPEPRTVAPRKNPQSLLAYGNYKVGKTAALAALPNSLMLELQPGGADFVPHGRILQMATCDQLLETLAALAAARKAEKAVCRRLVIDHMGILDDWMFDLALENFKKSPLGGGVYKSLNRITDLPAAGGTGGSPGWSWYWQELSMMYYRILAAAEEIIFISHIRDKSVKKEAGEVVVEDVDLTGAKARRLFCGQSSAIGFMFRRRNGNADELVISFKTSDAVIAGCSCQHLTGKEFVIGRSEGGGLPKFDWSAIFLPDP